MRLTKKIPEYGFLVLINLLVSEWYHTLRCYHKFMKTSNVKLNKIFNNFRCYKRNKLKVSHAKKLIK